MDGFPARTVCWYDHFRVEFFQSGYGRGNDLLKERAGEMKSTDHRMDLLDTGEFLGLADGVNRTSMTATGEHYQSFVFHVDNHSLIIMDIWVFLPLGVAQGVV